ncbi:LCP family protein [Natronosporangium hydrolyticum]|uniref:LCP family protein n=2 Tax=Natronosporangium hydrolyticum TaxID=2811111 RepID=A0A895YNS0_9ACTN|nr:LCP family protein [Natronosporangium hydrolyticum]
MVTSGSVLIAAEVMSARISGAITQGDLFGEEDDEHYGEDIEGPLTFLLAGLDTRPSRPEEPPRADSVMLLHVPAEMDRGYLISLPRDALVEIPAFPETGYLGGQDRLNSAMFLGARQQAGEELPNLERGFRLLAQTVGQLTGVERFDAGAVIQFEGFVEVVDALGGITVELDEEIYSRHRHPDGSHRPLNPHGEGYLGEQAYYPAGVNELEGWQALDISRQRYGVDGSDFGRQQLQQMVLKAMLEKAVSRDMLTNPVALDRTVQAAGDALVFDGRGNDPIDFAFALRDLRPGQLTQVTLPAENVGEGSAYQGEALLPEALELFSALRHGQLDQFILENPDFVVD